MLTRTGIGCTAAMFLLAMNSGAPQAMGQNPTSSLRSRPVISPYFDLFREDTAGLPSYHMFLQRDRNIRKSFDQQQTLYQNQSARVNVLERRTLDLRNQTSGILRATTPQRAMQSGSFMQYSHYYQRPR